MPVPAFSVSGPGQGASRGPESSKLDPVFGKSSLGNGPPMTMGSDNGLTFGVFDVGNGHPMSRWSDNGLTFGVFDVKNRILSWGFWILRPRP